LQYSYKGDEEEYDRRREIIESLKKIVSKVAQMKLAVTHIDPYYRECGYCGLVAKKNKIHP